MAGGGSWMVANGFTPRAQHFKGMTLGTDATSLLPSTKGMGRGFTAAVSEAISFELLHRCCDSFAADLLDADDAVGPIATWQVQDGRPLRKGDHRRPARRLAAVPMPQRRLVGSYER